MHTTINTGPPKVIARLAASCPHEIAFEIVIIAQPICISQHLAEIPVETYVRLIHGQPNY
jgi:hypothetical protein